MGYTLPLELCTHDGGISLALRVTNSLSTPRYATLLEDPVAIIENSLRLLANINRAKNFSHPPEPFDWAGDVIREYASSSPKVNQFRPQSSGRLSLRRSLLQRAPPITFFSPQALLRRPAPGLANNPEATQSLYFASSTARQSWG